MYQTLFMSLLTSAGLFTFLVYYTNIIDDPLRFFQKSHQEWKQYSKRERPLFLWWTTFHRRKGDLGLLKPLLNCSIQCDFTYNRSLLHEANVVVFHGCDLNKNDLPQTRAWQIKMYLMLESPARRNHFYNYYKEIPMNYFNTTSLYRSDSDYWLPYFTLPKLRPELPVFTDKEIEEAVKKKKNGSFSLISHCWAGSNRDRIINRLANMTQITKYGRCGTRCNKECEEQAIESFHFFLAFENTVCEQYVTEKFGRFKKLIVPITLKRSNVPALVPQDAFIAVDDFCSLEALADHMNYLMNNVTAYKSYFSWTKNYSPGDDVATMCRVCEDAYNDKIRTTDYTKYKNIAEYFNEKQCSFSFGHNIMKDRCDVSTSSKAPTTITDTKTTGVG